jgi:hypothetical protein
MARAASSLKVTFTSSKSKSLASCFRIAFLGLGKDLDQGSLKLVKDSHNREPTDKLGNEAICQQILGLSLTENL